MKIGDRKGITVRPMTRDDIGSVAAATARAFEDDPLFSWLLPDDATRVAKSTVLYEAMFKPMLKVDFVEMSTTADCSGLAMWAGPEKWDPPTPVMLGALPRMIRAIGFGGISKLMAAMNAIKKVHPKEPHWYLAGLATDPPAQRTGVGTALVAPVLERCDRERLGAYLETQKPENVPYYERFGFRVTKEIDLPKDGPHLWLMWRDPH